MKPILKICTSGSMSGSVRLLYEGKRTEWTEFARLDTKDGVFIAAATSIDSVSHGRLPAHTVFKLEPVESIVRTNIHATCKSDMGIQVKEV